MKKILSKLLGGALLFSLTMSLTSCEDILGHWEKPTPNPITPPSGGETPVTPEEIYAFSLRNMADDADITAGLFKLTDQNGTEIAYATSDGKYTIKADDLSSVTTLWLEVTSNEDKKYIAKATVEELSAIAEAGKLKMATLGDVILSDGKFAATSSTGTKVAMIAYLGSDTYDATFKKGLAIALADEASSDWSTAMSTCGAKTAITGAKWCLPSQDQWKQMFKANGGNNASCTGLNTAITTAGGTTLQDDAYYWSSSELVPGSHADRLHLDGNVLWNTASEGNVNRVRACLAF